MHKKFLVVIGLFAILFALGSSKQANAKAENKVLDYNGMYCYIQLNTGKKVCDLEFEYKTWYGDYFWKYQINGKVHKWEQHNDDHYHVVIPWKSGGKVSGWMKLRYVDSEIGDGKEVYHFKEVMPKTL